MNTAAQRKVRFETTAALPATVIAPGDGVQIDVEIDGVSARARLAVAGGYRPTAGDSVLVVPGASSEWYIVGVFPGAVVQALKLDDGTTAEVSREANGNVLSVRDPAGQLLFEHRPAEGKTVVQVPQGNLELRASEGHVDLVAGRSVRVHAAESVELTGLDAVRLRAPRTEGDPVAGSNVELRPDGMLMASPEIDARARRVEVSAEEGRVLVRTIETVAEHARHVAGVIETEAGRILERAKNVYRDVEELSQTRAGRMRMLAETTLHVLGRRTVLKGEKDVKIKGEKIYLA